MDPRGPRTVDVEQPQVELSPCARALKMRENACMLVCIGRESRRMRTN
jgi:hypothetical protein